MTRVEDLCHTGVFHKWLYQLDACAADIFTTGGVPGRSAALDVCVASSTAAAARGDAAQAAFDREVSHYRNCGNRAFTMALSFGRRTDDRTRPSLERFSTQQTLPAVGMGSRCPRNHFIAGGSMESKMLSCDGEQPHRD